MAAQIFEEVFAKSHDVAKAELTRRFFDAD